MWYTKKGDDGTSKTFSVAARIPKSDVIFEALGNVDELNSWLGFLRSSLSDDWMMREELLEIQYDIFTVQAELSGGGKTLPKNRTNWLEKMIQNYGEHCPMPKGFVVPGATERAAVFDIVRTVARRAERSVLRAQERGEKIVSPMTLSYLNRLSSYFYICARCIARKNGAEELYPKYR